MYFAGKHIDWTIIGAARVSSRKGGFRNRLASEGKISCEDLEAEWEVGLLDDPSTIHTMPSLG